MLAVRLFRWGLIATTMLAPVAAHAQTSESQAKDRQVNNSRTSASAATPVPAVQQVDPEGDKPIVPDADFEAELPAISDDIEAPLAPVPGTQPAPVTAQPESHTLMEPKASAQEPGAVPLESLDQPQTPEQVQAQSELEAPLPPLGGFDSVPLQTAGEEQAGKIPEIHYDVSVEGLKKIGLDGQFHQFSALEDGHGKAENGAMVDARASQDEQLAVRLMKSIGYYDASAHAVIAQIPNQPGRLRVTVSATPGELYTLGSIKIDAEPTVPPDLIRNALPLKVGEPIDAARIEGAEANVSLTLPQRGYPFASVKMRDVLLDDKDYSGDYTLPVDTGPRSSFGSFVLRGKDPVFDAKHIAVLARFKRGDLYDESKTDDLRKALVATGLFSTASVRPIKTDEAGPDGTTIADLQVRQVAGPSRTLAATAGYSTGEGFKIEGSWTSRNLFPPEGAVILNGVLGSQQQGAGATFRRSNAGRRDRTFSAGVSANHNNYDAYDAFTGTLFARWAYDSTPLWQKTLTYAYGAELIGTNESVYDLSAGERVRRTYGIVTLPAQVVFDQSDDLLNPAKGYRLKLNLSPETSVHGALRPYARTMVEATGYFPVSKSLILAGRVRAGSIFGIDRDDLAPSRRYYGGGGGSVRGYGFQRLGPLDPNGDPMGGRSINEFSIEARYRFGDYGIVPFFDGGNAYSSTLPGFNHLHFGAGIGGRIYTNFGPLRVDVATPLNPRKGDGRIALYISIGQAF